MLTAQVVLFSCQKSIHPIPRSISMSNLSKQQSESRSGLFSGGIGIFCVLAAFFVMSQFLRVSNAVVAKELMRDLGLTAAELGTLGSAFFYSFAFVQVPLGWALDRFDTRMLMVFVPLSSALGSLLFSMADGNPCKRPMIS